MSFLNFESKMNAQHNLGASVGIALLLFAKVGTGATLIQHVEYAGGNNAGIAGTAGTKFQVGDLPLLVNALGIQDVRVPSAPPAINGPNPETPPPDGLKVSHQIGIWSLTGSLLGSVVIPSGGATTIYDSAWTYVALDQPLILQAGSVIVIGAELFYGIDPITDNGLDPFAFSMSPDVTGIANVLSLGGFQMPAEVQLGGVPRWAPANLIYEVVPEPSTLMICCASLLLLFLRRR